MFTTPQELQARREAKFRSESLESARAWAQRCLDRGSCDGTIRMEFHSTHHAAVETVHAELIASGWQVTYSRINPGFFSHYIHVRGR